MLQVFYVLRVFVLLKGWFTAFFICMIVFMGCNITCIRGFSFLKSLVFPKFHLYCKSFELLVDFLSL